MMPFAAFALAGCLAVPAGSDQISAGDLAAAFPAWGSIAPTAALALAPAPGAQRVLHIPELRALDAAQLRLEMRDEFPGAGSFAASIDQVAGRVPRRAIAAGTPLRIEWLAAPKEVTRGETVKVEVVMGGARLELEAQAEASGAIGDTIPVLNPVSKKRFSARVDGKGKVSVTKGIL